MTARRYPPLPFPRGGLTAIGSPWLLLGRLFLPWVAVWAALSLSVPGASLLRPILLIVLAVLATGVIPGGWADVVRAQTWQRRRVRHVSEPWFADHAWDPRGIRRSSLRRCIDQDVGASIVFTGILLIVGGAMALVSGDLLVGAVGLGLVAIAAWLTVRIARDLARGTVDVTFFRFPFVPGDPVELHVGALPGGPTLESCVLSLRRIEERPRSRWSWRPKVVPTYADQRVPTVAPGPDQYVVVSFDVPEGAGGTCLSSLAPSYWELVVDARVSGRRFLDRFLIPIYERPPGAVAPAASATAGA